MEHVASLHERVQGTLYHYVLRWRGVESPTDGQAFDAVAATLPALHMRGHQRVAAVHRNTDHVHTHVTVNPFNPKTLKSVYPKGDWLTLDRACWELELKTVGATIAAITVCRHRHADGGGASTTLLGLQDSTQHARLRFRGVERPWDFSGVEGREPAQQLKRLLERSDMKWQHVRESLAGFNLEYRAKGSGAVVIDRDKPDKLHPKPATWPLRLAGTRGSALDPSSPVTQLATRPRADEQPVIAKFTRRMEQRPPRVRRTAS